jgi:hypothetical protein
MVMATVLRCPPQRFVSYLPVCPYAGIVPTDLERCRESEQGRRQIFEVADADLGARGRLCPSESLLHARRRTRRHKRSAFRALHRAHPRRRAGTRAEIYGNDPPRVLDAMRAARFSIWRIEQPHKPAGLIVTDVLRDAQAWLIDEQLEASAPENTAFAGRLVSPEDFAITCGVVVPVDRDLIEEVTLDTLAWRRGDPEHVAQDPRFAIAVYRAAIDNGTMGGIAYV